MIDVYDYLALRSVVAQGSGVGIALHVGSRSMRGADLFVQCLYKKEDGSC